MRRVALLVLIACGKPPPPNAPTERAADMVADIAGRWVTSDEMDWGYSMTIETGGVIDVWIDRGKKGRCQQRGTIEPGDSSRVFRVTYSRGGCNPDAVNTPIDMTVKSFTGNQLTIIVGGETRVYERAGQ